MVPQKLYEWEGIIGITIFLDCGNEIPSDAATDKSNARKYVGGRMRAYRNERARERRA